MAPTVPNIQRVVLRGSMNGTTAAINSPTSWCPNIATSIITTRTTNRWMNAFVQFQYSCWWQISRHLTWAQWPFSVGKKEPAAQWQVFFFCSMSKVMPKTHAVLHFWGRGYVFFEMMCDSLQRWAFNEYALMNIASQQLAACRAIFHECLNILFRACGWGSCYMTGQPVWVSVNQRLFQIIIKTHVSAICNARHLNCYPSIMLLANYGFAFVDWVWKHGQRPWIHNCGMLCHIGNISQTNFTWLILPVVICLSQRLSHACLSLS